MITETEQEEYQALREGSGFVWHEDRALLRFSGPDAAKFLHNFCTANVNALESGDVTEGFVLDSRGKTISFGHILRLQQEIYWTAASKAHAEGLRAHFDKYIIREDVAVEDVSNSYRARIAPLGKDVEPGDMNRCTVADGEGMITGCGELAGPCRFELLPTSEQDSSAETMGERSMECSLAALEMVRLEYGTPWFGREVGDDNLPQELRRDEKAISFTKGCYLGQETVAKIDAIGHVNRFLVGLQLEPGTESGAEITADDEKKIGELKSVAWSPALDGPIGLGFVKRQYSKTGSTLLIAGRPAEVAALPAIP